MIVVTSGANFIGSNIVKALNDKGITGILMVDNLKDGTKLVSLVDLDIASYMNKENFLIRIMADGGFGDVEAIFHEDVYSPITERDGKYMMDNNYQYSKELLHYCLKREVPFLYTSSATTYGERTSDFIRSCEYKKSLSAYGHSKFLFDEYVRQILPEANSQIVSFHYFDAYRPREGHKGNVVSVVFRLNIQLNSGESPRLFEGSENFERDFVYVGGVADVNLWSLESGVSGVSNLDTSRTESFQAVAGATFAYHKKGQIEYIPFPDRLKGRYQTFIQADLANLRATGCDKPSKTIAEGVAEYMTWLDHDA